MQSRQAVWFGTRRLPLRHCSQSDYNTHLFTCTSLPFKAKAPEHRHALYIFVPSICFVWILHALSTTAHTRCEVKQRGLSGIHCDAIQAGRLVRLPETSKLLTTIANVIQQSLILKTFRSARTSGHQMRALARAAGWLQPDARRGGVGSATHSDYQNGPTRALLPARQYYYARLDPGRPPTRKTWRQLICLYDPHI